MRLEPFSRLRKSERLQRLIMCCFTPMQSRPSAIYRFRADELNIDMLSASGHKFNGPKGIGFLYIRKGIKTKSFIHGGAQERKRRAGTENLPGIVGIGEAARLAAESLKERQEKEIQMRDYLINRITAEVPYVRLNGHRINRLPNNVNLSFQFIEGESLLIMLDMAGICGSSGSACTSGSLDPVPRTVSHWTSSRNCPWFLKTDAVRGKYDGRNGLCC